MARPAPHRRLLSLVPATHVDTTTAVVMIGMLWMSATAGTTRSARMTSACMSGRFIPDDRSTGWVGALGAWSTVVGGWTGSGWCWNRPVPARTLSWSAIRLVRRSRRPSRTERGYAGWPGTRPGSSRCPRRPGRWFRRPVSAVVPLLQLRGTSRCRDAVGHLCAVVGPVRNRPATPPELEDPSRTWVVIERVEVPVPVDDTAAEMVQMQLAAAAVIAVTVTKARIRRRYDRPA
jgi:hypothetical protein